MQQKIRIPEPSELLTQLISPSDISVSVMNDIQILAQSNTDALKQEFERRAKLDGIKGALENKDYDLLREIFEEMYGQNMITAGKQLIVSYLALNGVRVKDETHIAETIGQWIEMVYEDTGLDGLYDWATNIDVAMQVVEEYEVIFNSEIAKQSKNKKETFTTPEMVEVDWEVLRGNAMESDFVDTDYDDIEVDDEDDLLELEELDEDDDDYIDCLDTCTDLECDGERCNPDHPNYVSKTVNREDNGKDAGDTLYNISLRIPRSGNYPFE